MASNEAEWKTRKKRIDPKLDAAGWRLRKGKATPAACRSEEHETTNGPADYALWLDGNVAGVIEAKKVTVGPQNVLTQAARYAREASALRTTMKGTAAPSSTPPTARSSGSTTFGTRLAARAGSPPFTRPTR